MEAIGWSSVSGQREAAARQGSEEGRAVETHSEILYVARVRVRVREPHPALAHPLFQSMLGNGVRR